MCQGIFLHFNSDNNVDASGEVKKVRMQIKAMQEYGFKVKEVCIDKSKYIDKLTRRIPLYPSCGFQILKKLIEEGISCCSFIYIRKYIVDSGFLFILKKIKKINPNIKILFEIPSYPYDSEWDRLIDRPMLWKEKYNRRKLCHYIDRIVTLSDDENIWNIPTLIIGNGIDIMKNQNTPMEKEESNTIILVGVALVAKWHGYDRVIKGLEEYYSQKVDKNVSFWIVGDGPELNALNNMVQTLGLENKVIFKGKKYGKELEEIYNQADIGVGCLGLYRKGVYKGASLKVREYCARGLPFIKGDYDKVFDDSSFEYMLTFSNDDTPIDINKVVEFYSNIKNKDDFKNKILSFAEDNLSWKKQMDSVLNYLKESIV